MKRSEINPMPAYFDRYILLCDEVEMLEALQICLEEASNFPIEKWRALGDNVYAPGKWTVKDILQHLIDTERIFAFRALAFARGEAQILPSYSEDEYALQANATTRSLDSLIAELQQLHRSTIDLFQSFTPEMLAKTGMGFKGEYSVAAIGFILAGHQRWHLKVLEERYYPNLL